MPEVTFTKENFLEKTKIDAGWYKLTVKEITEKPGTKDPTSTTYPTHFTVKEGKFAGVPCRKYFTEKMMGDFLEFLQCFSAQPLTPGQKVDYELSTGKDVQGYCVYNTDMNWNDVTAFRRA